MICLWYPLDIIRTVEVIIVQPNGPHISVQNGEQRGSDAAHSSSRAQMDVRHTRVWCCLRVLLGGSFVTLCSLHVDCVQEERATNGQNVTWYVCKIRPLILKPRGLVLSIPAGKKMALRVCHARHTARIAPGSPRHSNRTVRVVPAPWRFG